MRLTSLLFVILLFFAACKQPNNTKPKRALALSQIDSLGLSLDTVAATKVLPGFAVTVFNKDSVIYQKGFGVTNYTTQNPYSPKSIQIIASVTKTLVGVALMKAVEDGLLQLDDPVNNYLSYPIVNPNFPKDTITLRMLAAHTSSIYETKNSDKGYRFETPLQPRTFPEAYRDLEANYNKRESMSMATFLQKKLDPQGEWYEEALYINKKPGTYYEYSNVGIALLAHIIELKTGQPFTDYTRDLILDPLKMQASFWDINKVPSQHQVTYYNELKNEVPNYYIITYPDGGLYSSVADMTTYLQEMMKGYEGNSKLLSKTSFREMMKKQFESEDEDLPDGLCWDLSFDGLIGHSGNDFGTATLMYFSPKTGIGRILFTNITIETETQEDAFYGTFNTMFQYDFAAYQKPLQ